MKIRIKKTRETAVVPAYATEGSAAFDLVAATDGSPHKNDDNAWVFPTGLAFEIPDNHVMLIFSRSGHGFKEAVRLSNCVGVIDSDYRGEVAVSLRADGDQPKRMYAGDRIAQAMFVPYVSAQFELADELSETKRGTGGFGSTGA